MDDELYVVLFRSPGGKWQTYGRPVTERRLAENAVEIEQSREQSLEFGYLAGRVVVPASREEQLAAMGAF